MKKIWITVVAVIAAIAGGYFWMQAQNAKLEAERTETIVPKGSLGAPEAVPETEAEAASEESTEAGLPDAAARTAGEAADGAAAAVTDMVEDAGDAAGDMASDAAQAAGDAAGDMANDAAQAAGDAVSDMASEATGTVTDMANEATEAVGEAVEGAGDTAGDAMEAATEAVTGDDAVAEAAGSANSITDLLSVDSFDSAKITEMIEASDLGAMQKTALTSAVQSAGENPEAIQTVIDQIRQAMGL